MTNFYPKSSLKIIPFGGVGNVTKNMYVYEYENEMIVVDCGVGFPDDGMPGVDLVIPDASYLINNKEKLKAFFLTHGHDDHIGALPYLIKDFLNVPVYASRLTGALVEEKFREFHLSKKVEILDHINEVKKGPFLVKWISVNHSVPDTLHFLIETPVGLIYHGSDFKFDWTPPLGKPADIGKIAQVSNKGVLCLLSDCLGSEREGATLSEKVIEETLDREIRSCQGKFIVTTQSSNISRLKQAIEVGLRNKRKIVVVGKSMISNIEVAKKLNIINIKEYDLVLPEDVPKYPSSQLLLLISGSQGQENSALVRIANDENPYIKIKSQDVVVFSSDPIPGNENNVYNLIDTLAKSGTRAVYSDVQSELHVSGHGSQSDLSLLIHLTKPKFLFPIGGTYRHMQQYSLLAQRMGYSAKQIILGKNGQSLELTENTALLHKKIEIKNIMIDGLSIGDIGNIVLRDRIHMSADGIVVIIVPLEQSTGNLSGDPEIISRGFTYGKEAGGLFEEAKIVIKKNIFTVKDQIFEWNYLKKKIEEILVKFFFKKTKRRPMIVTVIIEV